MDRNELETAVRILYEACHRVVKAGGPEGFSDRIWSVAWDMEHWLAKEKEEKNG